MSKFTVVIFWVSLLALGGCVTAPTYDPEEVLEDDMGLVVIKFNVSGSMSHGNFAPSFNGSKFHMHLTNFLVPNGEKLFIRPMKAGTYTLENVLYMQGIDSVNADISCLGSFTVKPNELTYAGDVYFNAGEKSEYVVFANHTYSFDSKNNLQATIKEAMQRYPSLYDEYTVVDSFLDGHSCERNGNDTTPLNLVE
jgi:hypothetical protein